MLASFCLFQNLYANYLKHPPHPHSIIPQPKHTPYHYLLPHPPQYLLLYISAFFPSTSIAFSTDSFTKPTLNPLRTHHIFRFSKSHTPPTVNGSRASNPIASSSDAAPISTQLPEMLVSRSPDRGTRVVAEVELVAAVVVGSLENVGPIDIETSRGSK